MAGYGAPAKATTLLYHFGIAPGTLDFIVDDSPLKQGLYSPGLHIPVVPAEILLEKQPDILVILAWNFAGVIMEKNAAFADKGRALPGACAPQSGCIHETSYPVLLPVTPMTDFLLQSDIQEIATRLLREDAAVLSGKTVLLTGWP